MKKVLIALFFMAPMSALGHDQWADGTAVPAWVKESCCGPADAHLLSPDDFSMSSDGIHIKGIKFVVPFSSVLPSQDGQTWAFWNPYRGEDAYVYCFFYPGAI